MKTSGRVFVLLAVFFAIIAIVYWFWSYEWAGTILLGLGIGLAGMIGVFLLIQARRGPAPAEDRPDATPADAAGEEVGRFPTASVWPLVVGIGTFLAALGLVLNAWLALPGALVLALALVSMAREVPAGR
jgi:hypothetical protein